MENEKINNQGGELQKQPGVAPPVVPKDKSEQQNTNEVGSGKDGSEK